MVKFYTIAFFLLILPAQVFADVLFYNGKIATSDPAFPFATYMVVDDQGHIQDIGLTLPKKNLPQNRIDLKGQRILPGLIDSHIHFVDGGLGLIQTNLRSIKKLDALTDLLKKSSSPPSSRKSWFLARELDAATLAQIKSPRLFLDELFPTQPVLIFIKGGHAAIANTTGLKKLKKENRPDGILLESDVWEAIQKVTGELAPEVIAQAILTAQEKALSYGITTIGDNTFFPHHFKIYNELLKKKLLLLRIYGRSFGQNNYSNQLMQSLKVADPSHLKYHAEKWFVDASLSLTKKGDSFSSPGGKPFFSVRELRKSLLLANKIPLAFHIQGQEGLETVLQAQDHIRHSLIHHVIKRNILDHIGYALPDQLKRARELGFVATLLPGQWFDYEKLVSLYPQIDSTNLLNLRAVKTSGLHAALTSDWPHGSESLFYDGLNPFFHLSIASSARLPNGQAIKGLKDKTISLQEALEAYTHEGAYVLGAEKEIGQLSRGYRADFIILSQDILTTSPEKIKKTVVTKTYVDGKQVYDGHHETSPSSQWKARPIPSLSTSGLTLSPIIGYSPTLGPLLGGAVFIYPYTDHGHYLELQTSVILDPGFRTKIVYKKYQILPKQDLELDVVSSNFFENYYGEGPDTQTANRQQIRSIRYKIKSLWRTHLTEHFSSSFFLETRGRHEISVDKNPSLRLFPDEYSADVGINLGFDNRDNEWSTRIGGLHQVTAKLTPNILDTNDQATNVLQLEGETRYFHTLIDPRLIVATHISAGHIFGDATYPFRFRLGGDDTLRGFLSNRFRGSNFYLGQVETRYPLWRFISGVGFFEGGSAFDTGFPGPQWAYGGGLRFALPPDFLIKLRLDVGFSKDQHGLFFGFSEAY